MGNLESKDENMCSCSSSSSTFCGSCTASTYAVNHGKSFSLAEKSKASNIIRFVVVCSFFIYCNIIIVSLEEDADAPKKKKKKSKAAELEEHVVPVPTLLELDNEISAYRRCSDSSCFKDCRGGCFGKNFVTDDGDILSDRMKLVLQLFRGRTRNKKKEELESYCVELFRRHCTNLHSVVNSNLTEFEDLYCGDSAPANRVGGGHHQQSSADRFTHDWSVELDSSEFLPSGSKRLQLCRHSFSFLYGLKPNTMKRIANAMKDLQTSEIRSARQEKPFDHKSYFGKEYSLNDIQAIFDANGLDVGVSEARSGLVRASFSHIDAYLWMENYFYQFEHQPNSEEIHIDSTWKVSIYNEYLASTTSMNESKISLSHFKEIWLALFNIVKIRQVKRVSSKCWTCAYINEIRKKQKGDQVINYNNIY